MDRIAGWAVANPSAAASIASAIIAASVALIVFTITQMIARKREATQLLMPKLEQVYLLLNELSEHNARMFKLYHLALEGDVEAQKKLNEIDDLTHYGLDRAKKIIMHIRLYFPALSRVHQILFNAERHLNMLRYQVNSDDTVDSEALLMASGNVGHLLQLMESEIINNRDILLKTNWLPRWYRAVTQEQIDNPSPRPEGPYIHKAQPSKGK
ncbi:hypothetical protein [Bosea sp. NBC_00550]|uniref:hypothetical protein n=1 Tax=Bosea sp. NBC_00550 TaxID=2969621 RepID=UPI00223101FD|nr:hypothetical protein [Bosea sp. NBC_00550]UZF91163.1 hypothetical protein NWE53_18780 [Bosea sp. NBC_00550]